jgi:uncharacterized protein (DUF1800 family)
MTLADPASHTRHLAAVAAHRFGMGEADLATLGADPQAWVQQQLRAPAGFDAGGLLDTAQAGELGRRVLAQGAADGDERSRVEARQALRAAPLRAQGRLWQQQAASASPVAERWVAFWANHFCVSGTRGVVAPLVLPFEREAIRPFVLGPFVQLLRSASLHPAMLLYLDNAQSIGPQSRAGRRRAKGLNENQARELLELHTLGVGSGYSQADVTQAARLLTGWTVTRRDAPFATEFNPALHEPGAKAVLGQRHAEGPQAADALFAQLASHPTTARHVSGQLVRHFVADEPPPALVDALTERWLHSDGHLGALAQTLFAHPLAWQGPASKLKRPDEWLIAAHRVCGVAPAAPERLAATLTQMGQPPGRAPSPQGWPDLAADWLGPDALLKRVQWAQRFSQREAATARAGAGLDARALAAASLGPLLGEHTAQEIARADSGAQALALLLASPEFQRR